MKHPKFSRSFEVVSELPEPLQSLTKLAKNFYWTWNHEIRDLFRSIDKALWHAVSHNPVEFLASLGEDRLKKLCQDENFILRLRSCEKSLTDYLAAETWYDREYPGQRETTTVAYFCAEFGISESLPIYSGGLGILAGDHLKAASDLGVPLVGVGLLYNRGYFRQRLTHDGWQEEHYQQYDFYRMPLELVRGVNEEPLTVEVELPDRSITCQIWKAQVGRIPLYLLDSNVLANTSADQGITDNLYGGDEDMRIRQEIILGIGGMRALQALGIEPTVCHMNEGHAAFLTIERIRQFMAARKCDFKTARQVIVSGNVFTTHTPVPAGFDLFQAPMLERYVGKSVAEIGLPFVKFLELGRIDKTDTHEAFNMAVLAMENANHVNGVAELHARVTREMFQARWPNTPEDEVPIRAITNGIHTMTWISRRMAALFDQYLGSDWRRNPSAASSWEKVDAIPDADLWLAREDLRGQMVRFIRKRVRRDQELRQVRRADFGTGGQILDPRVLTIGFARRFATYKRAYLMLQDRERLLKLLGHPERPIQIVIAGKSHPKDEAGKKIIQDLFRFIQDGGGGGRMVFLEDYDMEVARNIVQGVDVWLNNPRRPMEASGTSGMKVVPNGGLNCSILDGWWDEGYNPQVGWAIGGSEPVADQGHQDWIDGGALYDLLEHEIAPRYYHRTDGGVPGEWIKMVKASIQQLAPRFSTSRMVQDYCTHFYMPSAVSYKSLSSGDLERARAALNWRVTVRGAWPSVRILNVSDDASSKNTLPKDLKVSVRVSLGALQPSDVKVEIVHGYIGSNRDLLRTSVCVLDHVKRDGDAELYEGAILFDSPGHQGYTARVVPTHEDVDVASELGLVVWQ